MDRPIGKYTNEEWPVMADEYLANFLKKQRDSLSELSAYTPPQTPGNSKDTIHDTSTAGPSSLSTTTVDLTLDQPPSCSKSKDFELPVIDLTVDSTDVTSFEIIFDDLEPMVGLKSEIGIVNLEPVVGPKSDKVLVDRKDNSAIASSSKTHIVVANPLPKHSVSSFNKSVVSLVKKSNFSVPEVGPKSDKVLVNRKDNNAIASSSTTHTVVANPLPKHSVSSINKSVVRLVKKPNLSVPEVSVASNIIKNKKYRFLGRKKSQPFTYKKQFDIFDEIKKTKSTNEQSITNNTVGHKINLVKMKPKETKKVFIVDSKAKNSDQVKIVSKNESNINENVKKEIQEQLKSEKERVCDSTHYDLDALIKNTTELEPNNSWSDKDQNFDSLLAMLQNDISSDPLENIKVEAQKVDIDSIIEDDTLLCNIEDTEDIFFASLFSPPMNQ